MNYELEFYKNEVNKLKAELANKNLSGDVYKQVNELVNIASEMKTLLIQVRNEPLPYQLAKRIDNVLKQSDNLE